MDLYHIDLEEEITIRTALAGQIHSQNALVTKHTWDESHPEINATSSTSAQTDEACGPAEIASTESQAKPDTRSILPSAVFSIDLPRAASVNAGFDPEGHSSVAPRQATLDSVSRHCSISVLSDPLADNH